MAILDILIAPNPILSQKAKPVAEVTDATRQFMDDMLETMYEAPGVGLAAPQVGVLEQIIVIDVSEGKDSPLYLINPKITYLSEELCIEEEGCLSAPDLFADVKRACEVEVEYTDYSGKERKLKTDGILAVCIQHEIDHLEGIMFYEHISSLRKSMMVRKLKKMQK